MTARSIDTDPGWLGRTGSVLVRPSVILGLVTLAIHVAANGGYGFFRDELYFIVCGQRLAWGYVDQPPLIPFLSRITRALLGDSLLALRMVPALVMAVTVALTAEFARFLDGGRFAQTLAGLCALGASVFLAYGMLLTTDLLSPLTWLGCSWCLVKLARTGNEKWWLAFGAIVGVSLYGKYLIGLYLVALAISLPFTPLRRSFARPWLYLGALLALLMIAPNLLWQYHNGWPFLELASAGANGKNLVLSPLALLALQVALVGPAAVPVWLAGLWMFAVRPRLSAYRVFAIAWVVLMVLVLVMHGKAYYPTPIYLTLLGGGAVWIESKVKSMAGRTAVVAVVALVAALLLPLALPVLPVNSYIAYTKALGAAPSSSSAERTEVGVLPQHFADMFGWPEMAAKVAAVYQALPPADRAQAVFFGRNYGEAAAIDIFGRPLGLPPAISGHNNYYLWGPQGHDANVVIVLGADSTEFLKTFREVTVAGRIDAPYAMPYETNLSIFVLRGIRAPLDWRTVKSYQ
jgi:hypothetical protein